MLPSLHLAISGGEPRRAGILVGQSGQSFSWALSLSIARSSSSAALCAGVIDHRSTRALFALQDLFCASARAEALLCSISMPKCRHGEEIINGIPECLPCLDEALRREREVTPTPTDSHSVIIAYCPESTDYGRPRGYVVRIGLQEIITSRCPCGKALAKILRVEDGEAWPAGNRLKLDHAEYAAEPDSRGGAE